MPNVQFNIKDWFSKRITRKPHFVDQFTDRPEHEVIDDIKSASAEIVILYSVNPWYNRYFSNLLSVMLESKKTFFLLTLGYENYSISSNVHIVSFPHFYWTRHFSDFKIKNRSLPYGFSCLNRKLNAHRALLGISLRSKNLLDQIIYSQDDDKCEIVGHAQNLIDKRDPDGIFQSMLPIRHTETLSESIKNDHSIGHPAYHQAYCNIVTETSIEHFDFEYFIPVSCVTEKSYKPFLSSQIPIFFAAQGHYEYFKKLGFEVMEDFVGSELDRAMVTRKCKIISDIVSLGREYAENYYFSHIKEITHNHQLINSDKIGIMILDKIHDFVTSR